MNYQEVRPPFTHSFREMPKPELLRYFDWFRTALPERVEHLSAVVAGTSTFESWRPDLSPASLDALGRWFSEQVELRKRRPAEMAALEEKAVLPIALSDEVLTNRTFSLCMDIGMYFSQVLLSSYPFLKWEQPLTAKRFIDYGQPVLVRFRSAPFNPARMIVSLAWGLATGKKDAQSLRALYEIWSNLVVEPAASLTE